MIGGLKWAQFKDLLPLIGAVIGYLAGLATTWIVDRRQSERERVRWNVDQQATTLTDLADHLREMFDQSQVALAARTGHAGLDSNDVAEALDRRWDAFTRVAVLAERVADPDLRFEIFEFADMTHIMVNAPPDPDSDIKVEGLSRADVMADRWRALNAELGSALRDLYPPM